MKSISTITKQLGILKRMITDPKHENNNYLLQELGTAEQALLWVLGQSSSPPSKMFKARRVVLDEHNGYEPRIAKPELCLSCDAAVEYERINHQSKTTSITFSCGAVIHWHSETDSSGSSWYEYLSEEYPCPKTARIPCVMPDSNSGSSEPRIDMPDSCLRCGAEVESKCDTGDHTQTVRITFLCRAAANWRAILCVPPSSYEESVYEVRPCRAKLGNSGEQEDG